MSRRSAGIMAAAGVDEQPGSVHSEAEETEDEQGLILRGLDAAVRNVFCRFATAHSA